jgi:hypothetical protein
MSTILLHKPIEVSNRLEKIGVTKEMLLEVVKSMQAAKNGCTDNDPPSAPGWSAWRDGTRRLREVLTASGWVKDDTDMISSAFHKEKGIKLLVCNTDSGTGLEDSEPQNCSYKGSATDRAVNSNEVQVLMTSILDQSVPRDVVLFDPSANDLVKVVHWYLCVYIYGETLRAELSCPVKIAGGYFSAFHERIILIGDQDGGGVPLSRNKPDDDADNEIPVTRKKAS